MFVFLKDKVIPMLLSHSEFIHVLKQIACELKALCLLLQVSSIISPTKVSCLVVTAANHKKSLEVSLDIEAQIFPNFSQDRRDVMIHNAGKGWLDCTVA